MRGFERLTRIEDALNLIMRHCRKMELGSEEVDVEEAWGRVLEENITSQFDVPPFDRSAVDGYAIKSEEAFSTSRSNPALFHIMGTEEAGGARFQIGKKQCYEIYTGAPIPVGADAVVMAEDCERMGDELSVYRAVPKFANISFKGEDIRVGEVILRNGERLKPWHVGVLASIGRQRVTVRRRPVVGIFSTGSELIDIANAKNSRNVNRIIDSTKPMIVGLLRELGCGVVDEGIVKDDLKKISSRLSGLMGRVDLIITIGGTSVGGKDLVPEAAHSLSKPGIIFHGLAARPGKPTGFGMLGETPFFMLPGYPVSALIGFEALIMPLLCRWLGLKVPKRERVRAIMARRVPTTPGIRHFLRVTLSRGKDVLIASPLALTGSGLLSSVTKADGLVVISEDLEGVDEGDEVEVELLRGGLSNAR
jgi:molybdopterin molybdotransferase